MEKDDRLKNSVKTLTHAACDVETLAEVQHYSRRTRLQEYERAELRKKWTEASLIRIHQRTDSFTNCD